MTQLSIVGSRQERISDPLFSEFALPLRRRFFPFGFPLDLETNSFEVIEAAAGCWSDPSARFDDGPVRISLGVLPGEEALPPRSTFRSRDHLLSLIATPSNFVVCDFHQNCAFGWVSESVARNHPVLRYRFLTSTSNMLLGHLALAPVHGALVARNGRGVLLAGCSFAGKSTLSYACARVGWTYISDDGTMLVRKQVGRYGVGDRRVIHLREDAPALFPELAGRLSIARPNGKAGLEVFTRDLPIATAPGCDIDHVVFLNRNEPGPARLRMYPPDIARAWLEEVISFGTEQARNAQRQSFERLMSAGIWELCYTDLDGAIRRLERLVDAGS